LRYPGQYADDETGLHDNTFRYDDPEIGRSTSPDPIGLEGGFNLYQYAPYATGWINPWGWAVVDALFEMAEYAFSGMNPLDRSPRIPGPTIPGLRGMNTARADMHAEIEAMIKAYDMRLRGGRGVLTITGQEACPRCKGDIKTMARALQLAGW
jgi:RHS repeat-associated protein